jgi:glycosyltransferase involved in cell wall biosynthesis
MRVALITDWMSHAGGTEAYFHTLRDGLRASGHPVALLACGTDPDRSAEYRVRSASGTRVLTQLANPRAWLTVRRMVNEFKPDVAVIGHFAYHLSPSVLRALGTVPRVAYLLDYKVVCPLGTKLLPDLAPCRVDSGFVCHRNGCVSMPHWLRDQPRYALIRAAIDRMTTMLTASATMQAALAAAGIATTLLPQPVPPPSIGYRRHPSSAPRFLYVGRLSREKGVGLLLAAFARVSVIHSDAELHIIGDGPLREELRRSAAAARGIVWHGTQPLERIEAALSQAWALVAPSLWEEPFGLVALEAIVRGVPAVASDAGGFAETITHGRTGLLFPTADINALTSALLSIASRAVFPTHTIDEPDVQDARRRTDPQRHIGALIEILERVRYRR